MSNTVLFLGATGGTTNACLAHLLNSGDFNAIALARTPQKLQTQLVDQQKISRSIVDDRLTIVQGDAKNVTDLKRALLTRLVSGQDATLPSMIISGLGGVPQIAFEMSRPLQLFDNDDSTLCETAAKALISALQEIYAEQPRLAETKPSLAFISTTGLNSRAEDVPFWMRFFYHQVLTKPHNDKRKMESAFRNTENVFQTVTGIRPTLLMGTGDISESIPGDDWTNVRAGTESAPVLGYTIKRANVGQWMFENIVKDGTRWRGEMCSLAM